MQASPAHYCSTYFGSIQDAKPIAVGLAFRLSSIIHFVTGAAEGGTALLPTAGWDGKRQQRRQSPGFMMRFKIVLC
jgi:hypothetical protein